MKKSLLTAGMLALLSTPTLADSHLTQAVSSDFRQAKNAQRDIYRNPEATLSFFGIEADDTVIELWPGAGAWYAEILGPYLADRGHYVAANFNYQTDAQDRRSRFYRNAGIKFNQWLEDNRVTLGDTASVVILDPPATVTLGQDESADMVLTFRNLHNWDMSGQLDNVFAAAYKVLKPGGVLGIVEHRANPGMSVDSGYMDEAQIIARAKQAGFNLEAKSEVNANPRDTKDYERGVWSLPPRLALGDKDKDRYLAIGESDRMTLKFVKKAR